MVTGLFIETHTGPPSFAMKISSTRPLRPAPVRASQRASATKGADFSSQLMDEPAAVGAVSSRATIGAVEGILAVQEVPTATDGRSRGIKRGHDILDYLDDIRLGLLTGALPKNRLVDLGEEIKQARDTVIDPRLSAILDDIELRAAVELAKLDKTIQPSVR